MNIWTGPRCLEQNVSQFDEERAFKPEALKKRNFNEKTSLGLSMRRNNNRPLPTLATLNPNSIFGGITPQKGGKKKKHQRGGGKVNSNKPMPTIHTARSDKASPETARALPYIGKQTKNQSVILKYDKENKTPSKDAGKIKQEHKWYEKKNNSKKQQQNVMAAPGKKKKVLTTEPATPTRLDLGNENCVSDSVNNFLSGNGDKNNTKILTTPFQTKCGESSLGNEDEGKFEEKQEEHSDYQATTNQNHNSNNNENKEEEEDIWEGYDHSHLNGKEYTEGDGQVQYDEYGGYYDEHGQYYDSHGGYYDENGEYVYPENYEQHNEYGNEDYYGGSKEGETYCDEGKTSEEQHNVEYQEMDKKEGRYTPYKHGRKPNVSPLRSPYPRNDNESKSSDDDEYNSNNKHHHEGKEEEAEEEEEEEEEGATAEKSCKKKVSSKNTVKY